MNGNSNRPVLFYSNLNFKMKQKIDREDFLNRLLVVRAGLSPREYVEQSSCFVFDDGEVMTYNDEVACIKRSGLTASIRGAVPAQKLLDHLNKMTDEFMDVEVVDGSIVFIGKRDRFGIQIEEDIRLPISSVEYAEKWTNLPEGFTKAVDVVRGCVSTDETQFIFTCIHLTPDFIESCDNLSLIRYEMDTGFKENILVRGKGLSAIAQLPMHQVSVTPNWLHFREIQKKDGKDDGLIYICRRYEGEFHNLDKMLDFKGTNFKIPLDLKDAAEKAAVAADESEDSLLQVVLDRNELTIKAAGVLSFYEGIRKFEYKGPRLNFWIKPSLLEMVSKNYQQAEVTEEFLRAEGQNWQYVTALNPPDEPSTAPKKRAKKETEPVQQED